MLGLEKDRVKLSSYSPEWQKIFAREEKQLQNRLGNLVVDIQHIGSTSIPGIKAKPIIDIMLTVENTKIFLTALKPLYDLGYRFLGNGGRRGRLFFVKGSKNLTHFHLHLLEEDSHYGSNYLFFRDYLRSHFHIAKEYESLKIRLSREHPYNRVEYSRFKSRFVKKILRKNTNIVYCRTDEFYKIYKKKSLFLQNFMDVLIQQRGIGNFIWEVYTRAKNLYNYDVPLKSIVIGDHLKAKFTAKELEIIFEEKEKSLEERMKIREAVLPIEVEYSRIRKRRKKLRRVEFLLMRSLGYKYREIAQETDCSDSYVYLIAKNEEVKVEKVAKELKKICQIIIESL